MTVSHNMVEQPYGAEGCSDRLESAINSSRLCQECASTGHSCCQGHEIYITWGDCRRIAAHHGQKDFYEYSRCYNIDYADQNDDPMWQQYVFRADGTRRVLKRHASGNCFFLNAAGCALPLEARPLVCRLYPHLYSATGILPEWDVECQAARTMAVAVIEQDIAGVAPVEAMQWHRLLYEEILWERSTDENWLNL